MSPLLSSIAINLDRHILQAALPLLSAEKVDAVEWSFDTLYNTPDIPSWFPQLLTEFGNARRLVGHGVFFSLFSGKWSEEQQKWLDHLKKMCRNFNFDHITEHFGFMTGEDFHKGAPLEIPLTERTLKLGQDRLQRMAHTCEKPVGLENLAFSYSLEAVKRQGDFLDRLVEPVNGFLILDLHNLYCQLCNFDLDPADLLQLYPLHRVREFHISGGSWAASDADPDRTVRRDTHDDRVPEAVFELLKTAIPSCPNVKFVVLEQLGMGLRTPESQHGFQADFLRMDEICKSFSPDNSKAADQESSKNQKHPFSPKLFPLPDLPAQDPLLQQQQSELSIILETATDYQDAQKQLHSSSLSGTDWHIERWTPYMLETAVKIAP